MILLRGVRQLLTFRRTSEPRRSPIQEIGMISKAAVLIRDGRIIEVGPSRRIENLSAARSAHELSAGGRVVIPAFVDPFFAPFSTSGQQSAETSGKLRSMASSQLYMALRHGTACFDVRAGLGAPHALQAQALRAFRALVHGPWGLRPTYSASPDTSLHDMAQVIRRRLASAVQLVPAQSSLARQAAGAGVPVKLYAPLGEGASAVRLAIETGASAVEAIGEIGSLDIRSLAQSDTVPVLFPFCGAHPAVARGLLDYGAGIALGTGFGHESPGTYSQQAVVELACARLGLSIEEALIAVTANAARATRTGAERGSIEPGKIADLIVLNCDHYKDFMSHRGVNRVGLMIKSGSVVKEPGGDAWKTW
jgi:imidazolonepropionase